MVKIVSVDEAVTRFRDALPKIRERYERMIGIAEFAAPAKEAEDFWAEMIRLAAEEKRRLKGLDPWDDPSWRTITISKGGPVIRGRIEMMMPKYKLNWTPYRDAIEKLVLEPKTVDPMENIDRRVKPIVKTLVDLKKVTKKEIYVPKGGEKTPSV